MTDKQALKKARELWGPGGGIDKYRAGGPGLWWYRVGVEFMGILMGRGRGKSWEEAFADAEARGTIKGKET